MNGHQLSPVAVLGCGAVGSALARALAEGGEAVVLWSRGVGRARELARSIGGRAEAVAGLGGLVGGAGGPRTLLVCVAERGLVGVVGELARAGAAPRGEPRAVVLHTNGLLGAEVLAPLGAAGWACGKLHPLVSLAPGAAGAGGGRAALAGIGYALGGEPEARERARALAERLGGTAFEIAAGEAARYHAAASLLAGGLVGLFELASRLAREAVVPPERGDEAFLALLRSVVANLEAHGARGALTGAVARGAEELVREHLRALRERSPEAARAYALLALPALELALRRGTVDPATGDRLGAMLRAEAGPEDPAAGA